MTFALVGFIVLLATVLAVLMTGDRLNHERHHEIMTALETLTSSVTAATTAITELTAEVDDAVTHIGNPGATDAQLLTLATAIDANTASTKAQGQRLKDAISALTPTPPTP